MASMGTSIVVSQELRGAVSHVPRPPESAGAPRIRSYRVGQTRAETLECTCPEFCERDHERD